MRYRVPLREDGLFFRLGAASLKPSACFLDSLDSVKTALGDKHIWIVGSSTYAREQLSVLFAQMKIWTRGLTDTHLTFGQNDQEALRALCVRLSEEPGGHAVLLAEDQYEIGFNLLCEATSSLLPVIMPTGLLVPALCGGKWRQGELLLEDDTVQNFLLEKTATVWGKNKECLDRIFYMLGPVYNSMTITGVVNEEIKFLAVGGRILSVHSPKTAGILLSDVLITTQEVLKNDPHVFTNMPSCTLVLMLDAVPDLPLGRNDLLLFYSFPKPADCRIGQEIDPTSYKNRPIALHNGYFVNAAFNSKDDEYVSGFRKTARQPEKFDNRIHVLGPSHVLAWDMPLEEIYCSRLQNKLNENRGAFDKTYAVKNLGVNGSNTANFFLCLLDQKIDAGDIVILHNHLYSLQSMKCMDEIYKFCLASNAELFIFNHADLSTLENHHKHDLPHLDQYCYQKSTLHFDSYTKNQDRLEFITELRKKGIRAFDILDCIDNQEQSIFRDRSHLNAYGHQLLAEYIYDKLSTRQAYDASDMYEKCILKNIGDIRVSTLSRAQNVQWLQKIPRIREHASDIVGSIVMNCNPFTLGHKHIITKALEKVDKLYIFAVQEDKSYFTFEERYAMIRDGVKELGSRVCVVPSGKLIISSTTFPDYFCKDSVDYEPDTTTDILIFGSTVAPALGIQVRLFGEEPYCKVTATYHQQLARLLPICGILTIQIPRLEQAGTAISASGVRRILKKRKFSQLARLVPPTTMPYLIKKVLPEEEIHMRDVS